MKRLWLFPLIAFLFTSCAGTVKTPDVVTLKGTVKKVPFEGVFYGIEGDDGYNYDPVEDLPEEFRENGLRVKFKGRKNESLVGAHMWGVYIEILDIEKA